MLVERARQDTLLAFHWKVVHYMWKAVHQYNLMNRYENLSRCVVTSTLTDHLRITCSSVEPCVRAVMSLSYLCTFYSGNLASLCENLPH